jgi:hypothetical protein
VSLLLASPGLPQLPRCGSSSHQRPAAGQCYAFQRTVLAQGDRIRGGGGRALTPWFTRKKNGRLYRYYLPTCENKEHAGASGLPSLAVIELEAAVLEQLRSILRAPAMVADVVPLQSSSTRR